MTATFETLKAIDEKLAAAGEYPLPDFWLTQGERLYQDPTANTLVARCGRGSIKSGFGTRIAENEVLMGDFVTPESEIHYWVDVSENKPEGQQRLRQYETHLRILGVPFERRGDEIVLPHLRRGFMVRAFAVGKVSGFRAIGWRSDELAKCAFDGAEPAPEVLASLRAMTVTHVRQRPKSLLLSSAFGLDDEHARLFALGNTADQLVCEGATWECNPSITEADTHALEPDPRIWSREYGNIPEATVSAALDPSDVGASFELAKADLHVQEVGGWSGAELRRVSMKEVVDHIAKRAQRWGAKFVYGDQREEASLRSLFAEHEITFKPYAWTATSKDDAIQLLRRLMRERRLALCEHDQLRRELLAVKARLTPSGLTQYDTNGRDYASALVTLAHAAMDRHLRRGGFVAIDASSLRGDAFTYICGRNVLGVGPRDYTLITIGDMWGGNPGVHVHGSGSSVGVNYEIEDADERAADWLARQ